MTSHRPPPGGSTSTGSPPLALRFPLLGGRTSLLPEVATLLASCIWGEA